MERPNRLRGFPLSHLTVQLRRVSIFAAWLVVLVACTAAPTANARTWSSTDGRYVIEAEAIAYNADLVVLRKPTGALVAAQLNQLSTEDQAFVAKLLETQPQAESTDPQHVWKTADGLQFEAQVIGFGRKSLEVATQAGKAYIDGKRLTLLDPLQQKLVLKIIAHEEGVEIGSEMALNDHLKTWDPPVKRFALEGVRMRMKGGEIIDLPFFLLDPVSRDMLRPGWLAWSESQAGSAAQRNEDFLLQTQASSYQQNQSQQAIAMMQLEMMATATGLVSMWEVTLRPPPNRYGRSVQVVVPARNSDDASGMALQRYPGMVLGPVRRVSR